MSSHCAHVLQSSTTLVCVLGCLDQLWCPSSSAYGIDEQALVRKEILQVHLYLKVKPGLKFLMIKDERNSPARIIHLVDLQVLVDWQTSSGSAVLWKQFGLTTFHTEFCSCQRNMKRRNRNGHFFFRPLVISYIIGAICCPPRVRCPLPTYAFSSEPKS